LFNTRKPAAVKLVTIFTIHQRCYEYVHQHVLSTADWRRWQPLSVIRLISAKYTHCWCMTQQWPVHQVTYTLFIVYSAVVAERYTATRRTWLMTLIAYCFCGRTL